MDFKRRTPIVSTPRLTSFKYRWAVSHVVVVSYCFSIATKNKGTTPWHGRGFFIIGVVDLESGMGIVLVFYSDLYFFNNNSCYHHNQVNIEKKYIGVSTYAFARKALIFYSALLCLSSAAEIRFEELAQLLHIFMLMLETEPTVLNSSTMLLPLPHSPVEHKRHKRASMCKMSYVGKFVSDSRSNPSDFWISCILSCCDVP